MQRLLKDAEKLPQALGRKFDLNNFADVVDAISLVQESLGIAGVAAEEAETTFSGSMDAMKASFFNVMGAITSGNLDIGPQLQQLAKATSTFLFGNFIPMLARVFQSLPQAISTFIEAAKPAIIKGLQSIFPEVDFEQMFASLSKVGGVIAKVFDLVKFTIMDVIDYVQQFMQGLNKVGAIDAIISAFDSLITAALDLSEKLHDMIPWEAIGTAVGYVVKFIAQIVQVIANFSQSLSGETWEMIIYGIGGVALAFKGLNFIKSFNPFSKFKKNAMGGVDGATSVVKSASSGIVSVIQSLGKSIAVVAKGIGNGIGLAFRGIGQGLAMVNPVTIAALAVPILALGAAFALMGMQGQGIATILQAIGSVVVSVGIAIGTILNLAIQGLASALVIVAPVLPTVAAAFASLSPLIDSVGIAISMIISSFSNLAPVITALGTAISQIVVSLGVAISQIAVAITPIVQIISDTFIQVVEVVSGAIVQIVEALAPFIPELTLMVQAIAPVLQEIVSAFNNLISQIAPILERLNDLLKTFGNIVKEVLEGAKGIIEGFGNAVKSILDGVSGVIDSIGNAFLNAGKGFREFGEGVKLVAEHGIAGAAGILAVAGAVTGLGAASYAGNLNGFRADLEKLDAVFANLGQHSASAAVAFTTIATSLTVVSSAIAIVASSMPVLVDSLAGVAPATGLASVAFLQFAVAMQQAKENVIAALSGLASSVGQAMGQTQSIVLASTQNIAQIVASVTPLMRRNGMQMGQEASKNIALGIKSGIGLITSTMQQGVNAIRQIGMSGVGVMRSVGAQIAHGLAQGMYSALGAVTAAANALIEQAERAARAKAQIHSPSRLFRDSVGIFVGQGVAVGIDESRRFVERAMDNMFNNIEKFNAKVGDMVGNRLAYSFDTGNYTGSVEVTYQREDSQELGVIKQALSTIRKLVSRDVVLEIDGQKFATATGDYMTDYQHDKQKIDDLLRGIR